jgi:hypothetical protein
MAIAAKIAMIATTIINSMRVKPFWFFMMYPLGFEFCLYLHWRLRSSPLVGGRRLHARRMMHDPCQQFQSGLWGEK